MSMVQKKFIVIALDGGAASGKSSTSKILSQRLNLLHVDTGIHYRTLSFMLLGKGFFPSEHEKVIEQLEGFRIETKVEGRDALMVVNDQLLGYEELRSPLVNQYVSHFSAIPELRKFLLEYQRSQIKFAEEKGFDGLIMDGRDIGSVVLPNADFRFFLEADAHTRHSRRLLQGHEDFISDRDKLDAARMTAPLVCPPGAIRIDTSHITLEEVAEYILNIIDNKLINLSSE